MLAIFSELQAAQPKPRRRMMTTNLSPLGENTLPAEAARGPVLRPRQRRRRVSHQNKHQNHRQLDPMVLCYFVYDSKKAGGLTVSHLRVSETDSFIVSDFAGCSAPPAASINTRWPSG